MKKILLYSMATFLGTCFLFIHEADASWGRKKKPEPQEQVYSQESTPSLDKSSVPEEKKKSRFSFRNPFKKKKEEPITQPQQSYSSQKPSPLPEQSVSSGPSRTSSPNLYNRDTYQKGTCAVCSSKEIACFMSESEIKYCINNCKGTSPEIADPNYPLNICTSPEVEKVIIESVVSSSSGMDDPWNGLPPPDYIPEPYKPEPSKLTPPPSLETPPLLRRDSSRGSGELNRRSSMSQPSFNMPKLNRVGEKQKTYKDAPSFDGLWCPLSRSSTSSKIFFSERFD